MSRERRFPTAAGAWKAPLLESRRRVRWVSVRLASPRSTHQGPLRTADAAKRNGTADAAKWGFRRTGVRRSFLLDAPPSFRPFTGHVLQPKTSRRLTHRFTS